MSRSHISAYLQSDLAGATIRFGAGKPITNPSAIKRCLEHWQPFNSLMIRSSTDQHFVPAVISSALCESLIDRYLTRVKQSILGLVLLGMVSLTAGIAFTIPELIDLGLVLLGVQIYIALDYKFVLTDQSALIERSFFSLRIRSRFLASTVSFSAIMILTGLLQCLGNEMFDGWEVFLRRYGTVLADVKAGAYWRLITGPFLHSDFLHWLSNFVALAFAVAILDNIKQITIWTAFLLGIIFGEIAFYVLAAESVECLTGVSAGINSLFGLISVLAVRYPQAFPKNFTFTIVTFSLLTEFISLVFYPSTALTAHFAGYIFGALFGCMVLERQTFVAITTWRNCPAHYAQP